MIFFSCQADDFNKKPRESSVLERWDGKNNPLEVMDSSYVTQFKLLPMSGQTLFEPWSDSYWPKISEVSPSDGTDIKGISLPIN